MIIAIVVIKKRTSNVMCFLINKLPVPCYTVVFIYFNFDTGICNYEIGITMHSVNNIKFLIWIKKFLFFSLAVAVASLTSLSEEILCYIPSYNAHIALNCLREKMLKYVLIWIYMKIFTNLTLLVFKLRFSR